MGFAVRVENGVLRVGSESYRPHLMCHAGQRNALREVANDGEEVQITTNFMDDFAKAGQESFMPFLVVGCVLQTDLSILREGDPIFRIRKILGGDPPIDGVAGDVIERQTGCDEGGIHLKHLFLRLPQCLDMAHRVVEVRTLEVVIVDTEGFLKLCGIRFVRYGNDGRIQVAHVVAADLITSVGETVGMFVIGGAEEKRG